MPLLFVLVSLLLIPDISATETLPTYQGDHNYSTYYVGNSPIILLSQHGGDIKPDTIPNRLDGCWTGTQCVWDHSCNETYSRDSTNCAATTIKDSYTKDIALCLQQTLYSLALSPNYGTTYTKPHLVVNELHRSKLDPNREIGEAAQNNSIAEQTYHEIHYEFMQQAKSSSVIQQHCKWGLVIDVHGQKKNTFINLGYDITTSNLQNDDSVLNNYVYRSSMKHLIQTVTNCSKSDNEYICPNNFTLSDIIRGSNSLGSILNSTYHANGLQRGYQAVPSELQPFLDDGSFYSGGTSSADLHGSRFGGMVDFVQLEIPRHLRFNETLRSMFCSDFSKALVRFIQNWYDVDSCFEVGTVSPSDAPTLGPTHLVIRNDSFSTTVQGVSTSEVTLTSTKQPNDGSGVQGLTYVSKLVVVSLSVLYTSMFCLC